MARGIGVAAVVTSTTNLNQSQLTGISSPRVSTPRVSAFRSSSPRVSSSLPLSHKQYPHSSHEDLQEAYKFSNNPELAALVGTYFSYNNQLLDMYAELKQSVKAVLERRTLTSCKKNTLAAIMASHEQMVGKVMVVLANHQGMRVRLKRFGATLEAEILVKNRCKDYYYAMFVCLAALSLASIYFAAKLYPKSLSLNLVIVVAVLAFVLAIVFSWYARRTDTNHEQLMNPVKKNKDIIEVIIGDNRLALCHLTSIKESANGLLSQIKSIPEMVDSGAAMESGVIVTIPAALESIPEMVDSGAAMESGVIVTIPAALESIPEMVDSGAAMESDVIVTIPAAVELGFQKLEKEVDWYNMDAYSSRQGVVQTINMNLD